MSDQAVNVRVVAQTSELNKGMAEAPRIVERASQQMRNGFSTMRQETSKTLGDMRGDIAANVRGMAGSFGGLVDTLSATKIGFVALAVVAAGIGFAKSVAATAKMTEEAMDLARVLGTSTNQAQVWKIALEDVGASQGELEGAAKGMSRQLKENEKDINAMGLATRDSAGNLRPMNDLLVDGLRVLNTYKEGADRALAAQQIFGRGVDASSKLLLVNKGTLDDAQKAAEGLGLEVGENAVAAWKDYDAATDLAGLSLKGLTKTVGSILMPVLTDLVGLFNSIMPAAIVVVRGALGGLAAAFNLVKTGVVVVWETINAFVVSVAEPIRAVVEAVALAMVGDFKGAAEVIKNVPTVITGAWDKALINIADSAQKTRDRIDAIFSPDVKVGKPEGERGTNTFKPPPKEVATKEAESALPGFEAALLAEKEAFAQRDALHDFAKSAERDFWSNILATVNLSGKDRIAVQQKVTKLEIDILREKAREMQQLDAVGQASFRDAALARVDQAEQAAQQEVALGNASKAELLAQEEGFEQRRFEIRRAALEAGLAALDPTRDPVQVAQANAQLEQLELQHQLALSAIRGQATLEAQQSSLQLAATLQSGFASVIARIGTSITSIGGFVKGMLSVVVSTFVNMLAQMAAKWLVTKLLMKAISKATALGEISAEAGKAGAGGVASMAAAPWPINLSAPAFGAAMSALAFGFAPLASASQGFDIPAGLAPITQLHPREMVLPEKQADVIRDLADGDGAGQAPIVFRGASAGDFFIAHKSELAKVMKSMRRNFEFQ